MSNTRTPFRAALALASLLVVGSSACDEPPPPSAPATTLMPTISERHTLAAPNTEVSRQLEQLRRLVAPFHDFGRARNAGWSAQITPCMESPPLGAMGTHFGNPAYIDGEARVLEPELLMYEPQPNGRFRFVGVEYIVPLSAWKPTRPPRLFGQEFKVNSAFGVWALHVWVGRENPAGLFADWNPKVSCAAVS